MERVYFILITFFTSLVGFGQATENPKHIIVPSEGKTTAYIGIVHPLVTFRKGMKPEFNFEDYYQMGMTIGMQVRRSPKFAWNLEMVPFVRYEDGVARMNNFLVHPGVSFYFKNNQTITPRFAFETSGRFGLSTILSKTVWKGTYNNFTVNIPLLYRTGNKLPDSFTIALNLTFGF